MDEREGQESAQINSEEAEEPSAIDKRKRNTLIAVVVICLAGVGVYLIYNFIINSAGTYLKKADMLLREKRYEEAVNFYNLVLERKPKLPEALAGLGSTLDSLGRTEEAIKYLDEAIKIKPKFAKAWNYKGNALQTLGKLKEALQCYDEALRIDPKYSGPWANKASIMRALKKEKEARECFDNYIKLEAKEMKVDITPSSIEEIVKRISPLIEEVSGLHYKNNVNVKLISPDEMGNLAKRNLLAQLKKMFPQASPKDLKNESQSMAEFYSSVICCRYDFVDKILYFVPDNFQADIMFLKINKSQIKSLLDLLVGHELVHALQDQGFNTGAKLLAIKNPEKKQIFDCIMEGHSIFVIEQISKKIRIPEELARLSARVSAGDLGEASPFDRMAAQYVVSLFKQIHSRGKEFVEFVHSKEGDQGIIKLFNNPPGKLSIVAKPQSYYQKIEEIDYAKVAGIFENYIEKDWQKQFMPVEEISLRANLSAWVAPNKLEEALAGFEEGFFSVYTKGGGELISLSILKFKNDRDAEKFFEVDDESTKTQWKMIKNSPSMSITVLQDKKLLIPDSRKATLKEAEISSSPDQRTHPLNILVAFENFVLDISFVNYKIDEGQVKEIILKIFEGLRYQRKWVGSGA